MKQHKFQVGDRVAVYGVGNRNNSIRRCSTITDIYPQENLVGFGSDVSKHGEYDLSLVHEKQCRKLIKKPRRRIWVRLNLDGTVYDTTTKEALDKPWIEFVEVKRK